jgi:cysteine desulfurase
LEPTLPERIYLDHAATTPIRPEAAAAAAEGMARWANPSSPHAEGRAARAALEDARARIFTSGASEALAIALGRAKVDRRQISAVEHDAVLRAAPDAEILPIREGRVDEEVLGAKLREAGKAIVAIQHVNPETGNALLYNPIDPVITQVREAGGIFLSDCAQSAGKQPIPQADMVVVSAHKVGGPPGIGALLVRDPALLEASGGQEGGYRGGTENLPGALGFAAALEAANTLAPLPVRQDVFDALFEFKDFIWGSGGEMVEGDGTPSMLIRSVAMPGLSAAAQVIRFDQAGFAVSAGSACSSGSLKPSRVLKAFGVPDEVAARTIRVSFGWTTSVADIHAFQQAWARLADEARARAA